MRELTTFAKRMREAREKCNLKQNILASNVGVTPQTISAYEKAGIDGRGKNPTLENAVAIANELNVSLDWLCGRDIPREKIEAQKTLGDIARDLIFLEKSVADVYFDALTQKITEQVGVEEGGYPVYEDIERAYPAIAFRNKELSNFITDWRKIKSLRDYNTIDDELYDLWLEKHISALDDISAIQDFPDFSEIAKDCKVVELDCEDDEPLPF